MRRLRYDEHKIVRWRLSDGMKRVLRFHTLEKLRADLKANDGNTKSQLVLIGFRIASVFAARKCSAPLLWVVGLPFMIAYRLIVEWIMCIEIPAKTRIGGGLVLWHGQGLVINPRAVIGESVTLRHNTTIGAKVIDGVSTMAPVLEDGVDVGSNVVIIGPITIGANAVIGAGSVVTRDVARGATVAGNPAREVAGGCE